MTSSAAGIGNATPRPGQQGAFALDGAGEAVLGVPDEAVLGVPGEAGEGTGGQPHAKAVVVYTDGACRGNPGPGGWAWAVVDGPSGSGGEPHTTNQRMEITAVLQALRTLPGDGPIRVVSDSTYVVNCFRQRWWAGWRRRGWRNTQGKPVANRDLWESLLSLVLDDGRDVTFDWVKGHSGDPMNDLVDQMATGEAARQ